MPAIDFTKIGEGGGIYVRPLIHEGALYFGACDKYFYALDAKTGREIWSVLAGGIIMSSAVFDNGVLFFGCFDNNLYAVSIAEKRAIGKIRTGGIIVSSPAVKEGMIYFGSCDTYFYAVKAKTREVAWRFRTGGEIHGDAAIDGERIYFGSTDKHLYCLGLDGNTLWKFRAAGEFLMEAPCICGDAVHAADSEGWFYAIDKNTGAALWKFKSGDEAYNCIACDEKNAYFGSRDRYLYAFGRKTHNPLWKFRANMGVTARPTVTEDRIYFGSDRVYCLDKKGNMLWAFRMSESFDIFCFAHTPVLHDSRLYFAAFDGYFRCLDTEGNIVWSFRTKAPRGVKLAPGAITPASWWDEKMFSVFEGGVAVSPPEPPAVLKKYGVDALAFLEEKIENPYLDIGGPGAYKKLESMKYVDSPATYVHKAKKKKEETDVDKLFHLR